MRTETLNEITDYIGFLENTGKLTSTDSRRIRKFILSPPEENKKDSRPSLLTREEVAGLLKVSTKTVSRLSDAGILKRRRVGIRAYRYLKSDIYEYLGLRNEYLA